MLKFAHFNFNVLNLERSLEFYKEALKQQPYVKVIHCDGIGRLAILICRDALERDFLQAILDILKIKKVYKK